MKFEFQFPDIGEGIHEGVITKWLVKEGDMIKEGDSVAEVETDKVTTEIPSPKTGKVIELRASNGDTIHVGDVFVVIDIQENAEDVSPEDKKTL
jgi:Pyruvate/2-oxoglutarate dehydrogenase complex, dihydrolipoamide acyltransferase (E2) component, and related enzymes